MTWGETAALVNRIAAQLRAEGLQKDQAVSILVPRPFAMHWRISALLRVMCCTATTSATPQQLAAMTDSGAGHLFIDHAKRAELADSGVGRRTQARDDGCTG